MGVRCGASADLNLIANVTPWLLMGVWVGLVDMSRKPLLLPAVVCLQLLLVKTFMQQSVHWSHGLCPELDILSTFGQIQSGMIAIACNSKSLLLLRAAACQVALPPSQQGVSSTLRKLGRVATRHGKCSAG